MAIRKTPKTTNSGILVFVLIFPLGPFRLKMLLYFVPEGL